VAQPPPVAVTDPASMAKPPATAVAKADAMAQATATANNHESRRQPQTAGKGY